jgi:cytochrome c553
MPWQKQGEQIYKSCVVGTMPACDGCHGPPGRRGGAVPRLAGQHGEYLIMQLQLSGMAMHISDAKVHGGQSLTENQVREVSARILKGIRLAPA